MNSLKTEYFLGTAIQSPRLFPLFLLFQNVRVLAPVERESHDSDKEPKDSFIKLGFCQEYTPDPLGPDRRRFLHLVSELHHRTDDYAQQLGSLTLAAMVDESNPAEESEHALVRSLAGPHEKPKDDSLLHRKNKLWQARLVLKIAELLELEEEEISENLLELEKDRELMLKDLHGDDYEFDDDEKKALAELSQLDSTLRTTSYDALRKRYAAWKNLFLAGDAESGSIFLAPEKGAGDILLEKYENKTGRPAELIETVPLPYLLGRDEKMAVQVAADFIHNHAQLLTGVETTLKNILKNGAKSSVDQSLLESWKTAIDATFAEDAFGRKTVSLYVLSKIQPAELIGRSPAPESRYNNGLLAVLG